MSNLGEKCAVLICIASIDRCIYYMYSSKNLKCFKPLLRPRAPYLCPITKQGQTLTLDQRRFISIRSIYPLTDIFRLKHVKCRVNLEISKNFSAKL